MRTAIRPYLWGLNPMNVVVTFSFIRNIGIGTRQAWEVQSVAKLTDAIRYVPDQPTGRNYTDP